MDVLALNDLVKSKSLIIENALIEANKVVVGQRGMLEKIFIGLLSDGHILLEGLPGLAKTLAVKTISDLIQTKFQRIQFTPDLLPSDLIGTLIYNQKTGEFTAKKGPLFANIILADEINRAPAKVQSALLEAMAEKQVTLGDTSYKLEDPFIVLATQNPIEQEGTYPLPEAQMDRFMLKYKVEYPTLAEERLILERIAGNNDEPVKLIPCLRPEQIAELRQVVASIYIDNKVKDYITNIVFATRYPEKYNLSELKGYIRLGGSPRATIYLTKAAKANAFMNKRGFVTPEDVKAIAYDVLRHRILTTYEAEAENVSSESIIKRILDKIEVP